MVKKVKKSPPIRNVKAEQTGVKQIVNVRVGDQYVAKKRAVKRRAKKVSPISKTSLGMSSPIISLSSQSFQPPSYSSAPILAPKIQSVPLGSPALGAFQPPSYVNEYNALLRELADERRARNQSLPPLGPNTAPLTTNQQRNELLSEPIQVPPLAPQIDVLSSLVNTELTDDPLTNENVTGFGSSRLAENIAQKLPDTYFDEEDIDAYDDENQS